MQQHQEHTQPMSPILPPISTPMGRNRHWAIAAALAFCLIQLVLVQQHEMWRDELQAWLLARDSDTPVTLLRNLKYEAHPAHWHLILMPLTRLPFGPVSMQIVHVLIASLSIFVLFAYAPFHWLVKCALSLSYFLAFEYSLIARNYAIGVLLVFILCALLAGENRKPLPVALALFLLCHTSALGTIIAIAFSISLFAERFCASKSARTFLALRPSQAVGAGGRGNFFDWNHLRCHPDDPATGFWKFNRVASRSREMDNRSSGLLGSVRRVPSRANSEHALLEHSPAEKGLVGHSDCTRTWRLTTRVCLFGPQEPSGTDIFYRCHGRPSLLLLAQYFSDILDTMASSS